MDFLLFWEGFRYGIKCMYSVKLVCKVDNLNYVKYLY